MKLNRTNRRAGETGTHRRSLTLRCSDPLAPRSGERVRERGSFYQKLRFTTRFARPGFTMIEIALALGVIAFALVAIIGILPFGLNVQKESHQDTVISQDAPFFLNAIRNGGSAGSNIISNTSLDFLTNYVEDISISTDGGKTFKPNLITSGKSILGALTTPEYYPLFPFFGGYTQTNLIRARIRSLSGNALEQNGANSLLAFRYFMYVEVVPFKNGADQQNFPINANLQGDLYDIHLKFSWPVTGVGTNFAVGPGRANFRSMISGQLQSYTNASGIFWYIQPNAFNSANVFNQ